MLMLDIAVVNTALPKIASSLDAGLSGLQWVVDAYTVALAAVVLRRDDRRLVRRRPGRRRSADLVPRRSRSARRRRSRAGSPRA
jgi:hypothetical protein